MHQKRVQFYVLGPKQANSTFLHFVLFFLEGFCFELFKNLEPSNHEHISSAFCLDLLFLTILGQLNLIVFDRLGMTFRQTHFGLAVTYPLLILLSDANFTFKSVALTLLHSKDVIHKCFHESCFVQHASLPHSESTFEFLTVHWLALYQVVNQLIALGFCIDLCLCLDDLFVRVKV